MRSVVRPSTATNRNWECHCAGLDSLFSLCSNTQMSDRPASWRMPSPKQIEKLGAGPPVVGGNAASAAAPGPADPMPPAYWDAVLRDVRADGAPPGPSIRTRRLSEIQPHMLRMSCSRCGRIVEVQKADAVRLYGPEALWRDVGLRLLNDTCQQRTGRYEEDGCWPLFE